jgi:hypothetical protein
VTDKEILDRIEEIDAKFSSIRSTSLYLWFFVTLLVLLLGFVGIEVIQDLGIRIGIGVGVVAAVMAMLQEMSDNYEDWIVGANYRRIREGERDDLILLALIVMKTARPGAKLGDACKLNPELFKPHTLVARLYA